MGIPHNTTEDNIDIYEGDFTSKDTPIIVNVWAITRDESRFPEPEEFRPERFLTQQGTLTGETPDFVFGFGRRVCPGRYLADASVWIGVV
ncbi:cytochrome P450 [Coniophora puteana RWD-64-598 SS2]|uniref:Cytochrome P450 n=1 Tax=Coniophora puteana (strain RWD-64-598) TaxID=741705 RepID=A0A5M3MZD8_CONPW|nr:cytochrome P450 [Coniophora puteana RWD-64-598 SS2]EIW84512.1 cytochrome P450 [Coniophora puteana RWD-64-598 SS2]